MTRSPVRANGKPASGRSADAGFTLIEVIVAIVLIGASLLTVVGAAAAAFGFQATARQQQVATTIATKKMEEMRALPFSVISAGMSASALSGDPNLTVISRNPLKYGLARCGTEALPSTETIPTGVAAIPVGVLSPHRVTGGATVDDIAYSWSTYISRPSIGDPFHATVCVTWTWKGAPRQTMVQSWIWSPQGPGCVGRPITAVGGPCASVAATVPEGAVAIEVTENGGTPQQFSFAIAGATSQVILADETVTTASYTAAKQSGTTVIDERTIVTADDDDANSVNAFADSLSVTIPQIPSAGTWLTPTSSMYLKYLTGTGRASASAVAGGSQCSSIEPFTAKNAVCASSGVNRDSASRWIEMYYHVGDGYWISPMGLTSAGGFNFGTYAIAGGGSASAGAERNFSLMRLGGIWLTPSSTPYPPTGTAYWPAELISQDSVSLSPSSPPVQNGWGKAAAATPGGDCTLLNRTIPAQGPTADLAYGCSKAFTAASSGAGSETVRLDFTWSWNYTAGSTYDSDSVTPGVYPRIVRSTSPALDLKFRVIRTYCTSFANGGNDRANCKNSSSTKTDEYVFQITLTLGAITATYDKQV